MALRNLTANLAERVIPNIPNNQTFNMIDAYSKYTAIDYKARQGFVPINTSDKSLQDRYEDYKKDNITPLYREVGNSYKKPYLISHAAEDTERISRWMASNEGILFNIKQFGLHLSQPKSHSVLAQQTRIWNPVQFLSNVPGQAIGAHIPNHGLIGLNKNYEQLVNISNMSFAANDPVVGNRMLKMWKELGYDQSIKVTVPETKIDVYLDKVRGAVSNVRKFLGINYSGKIIKELSGIGGPKSFFGLGFTDIRSYRSGNSIDWTNNYSFYSSYRDKFLDKSYSELSELKNLYYGGSKLLPSIFEQPGNISAAQSKGFSLGNIFSSYELERYGKYQDLGYKDVRKHHSMNSKDGLVPLKSITYNDFRTGGREGRPYEEDNMHRRVGIPERGTSDKIYDPLNSNNNNEKDFIRLRFTYAGEEVGLQFRATISSLSNNFSPEWNSTDYIGRPDSVYTYKGVKRSVTFSFIVAASSVNEMDTIYEKLNKLAGMTTPDFKDDGHMIGPVVKLRLGNYINDEVGYISSLDFNIEDDFIWDVEREDPMYIRVNVSFDIIGKNTPRKGIKYFGSVVNKG